ncbi:ATPase involved in DNA repair-like protein [Pseudodesulfovibrio profundus]|uniref:DNA repair protein RecN n=1 Tax=Pseudodesulfovibrio profundus TaxID=57320 RepID=A0A2C8FAV2_9BACT|nr:AAA family ATPase [Pseudodesulfovibrio profundus]SOB59016.1 ATPase involved in DNA repair-like protein [Pseudodesulfovibrio profundus]
MITKIILQDFMAHEYTELELGPGVNALTGPNNTGKSAIVEALRCIATNPVPKHFIRHGAKEARVTLEMDDGVRVVWIRNKRSPGYEIWQPGADEPQEYWKFGRKPPEDVLAALRLNLVELEGNKDPIDVHVGNQRDPVFLLNSPGSDAAAFFAASTESAHLLAMQNLLKRRTQDAKREERDHSNRLHEVETALDAFELLPDISMAVEQARETEAALHTLQQQIPTLERTVNEQEAVRRTLDVQSQRVEVLNAVQSAPELQDVKSLHVLLAQLKQVTDDHRRTASANQVLQGLAQPSDIHDTKRLASFCEQLLGVERQLVRMGEQASTISGLSAPPALHDTRHLSSLIDDMIASRTRWNRGDRRMQVMDTLLQPPVVQPPRELEVLLAEMQTLAVNKNKYDAALQDLEKQLESLQSTITERVEAIGQCPTCGGDMNAGDFLDRGCGHGC